MRFRNKVAIATGPAGGIGAAIYQRLPQEDAAVEACDVNAEGAEATAASIRAAGGSARAFASDIATAEDCRAIVADVLAREGRIDVLCNNAGINRRGALLHISEEDWRLSFAVDLDAVFHLCRAALPSQIEAGGGAIVDTASQ